MKCVVLAAGYATRLYPLTENFPKSLLKVQEKPAEPVSNWAVPPFYAYSKDDLGLISKAVNEGVCNVDAPGILLLGCVRRVRCMLI